MAASSRTSRAPTPRTLELVGVTAILALAVALRAGALTARDPWFDDAWVVLTGRYGLRALLHTAATAPGYDLGLSTLWQAHSVTWLVQLPELVLGVAGVLAVFALVRWLGCREPLPLLCALVVAASPVAATYSTRLKPYAFDLLFAVLLLFLAERWRRSPSWRALWWLLASSLLVFVSESALLVLCGAVGMIVLVAVRSPRARPHAVAAVAWLVGLVGLVDVVSLRELPASLGQFWKVDGAMLDTASMQAVTRSLTSMGAGLLGGLIHTPVGSGAALQAAPQVLLAACALALLLVLVLPPLVSAVRSRFREVSPGVAPALALAAGVVAGLADLAPFGSGRTDEVFYPAILVLVALLGEGAARRLRSLSARQLLGAIGAILCGVLVTATALHYPTYPTSDVRDLGHAVLNRLEPGEVVVVDGDASYAWAADRLSCTRLTYAVPILWTQGWHERSCSPSVVLAGRYVESDVHLLRRTRHARAVWFVSDTIGAMLGAAGTTGDLDAPVASSTLTWLHDHGFVRVLERLDGLHVYALLLARAAAPAR